MIICERCLEIVESHEGNQIKKRCDETEVSVVYGDFDEDGNFIKDAFGSECVVWCDWCEEYHPIGACWII